MLLSSDLRHLHLTHKHTLCKSPKWHGWLTIVGGCGHVGLPLGMAFANKGLQVDLLDTSEERVHLVNQGHMPFLEEGAAELLPALRKSGRLNATTDRGVLKVVSAVIVTIGTPVADYLEPSLGAFDRAMEQV